MKAFEFAQAAIDPKVAADKNVRAPLERLVSCRAEPLFFADWERAVFIHYEVDAEVLQREVPFELDLRESKAYVSLVAFTMRGLRPRVGGRFGAWLIKPIATLDYLNVRTYVRYKGELGIYFLAEWLNNRLSVPLGPLVFGLPYRFGRLDYQHDHESGAVSGIICEPARQLRIAYLAKLASNAEFKSSSPGSLDEFLLERYTAFTQWKSHRRFFRIWHPSWPQTPIELLELEDGLLATTGGWLANARLVGANYSPGARNVWMGRPHGILNGIDRKSCGKLVGRVSSAGLSLYHLLEVIGKEKTGEDWRGVGPFILKSNLPSAPPEVVWLRHEHCC